MPTPLDTVLLALVTSVVGTYLTMRYIQPRQEARKATILASYAAREQFSASVLKILVATARLRDLPPAGEDSRVSPVMVERLIAERDRWLQQVEDATRWMIDNAETFALTWPMATLRQPVTDYVDAARLVWISESTEARRLEVLATMTGAIHDLVFVRWWRRLRRMFSARRELETAVACVHEEFAALSIAPEDPEPSPAAP